MRKTVFAMLLATVVGAPGALAAPRAGRTIEDICLARQEAKGLSQAEFRECKAKLERSQGAGVQSGACSPKACAFRLERAGPGVYRGSGYTMRLAWNAGLSGVRATLSDPQGRTTRFEHSCGASGCPGSPDWIGGAHRGATYTAVGSPTAPSAVVLRLPR